MNPQNQEPIVPNSANIAPQQPEKANKNLAKWIIVGFIIIVVSLVIWFIMSKQNSQNPNNLSNQQTNMNYDLKSELEVAYNKVRTVITSKGDQTAFAAVFEENTDPALPPLPADQWPYVLKTAENGFPDLSNLHFISEEENGDYAYYFAWMDAHDKPQEEMLVWNYVFHKTTGGWKLTGYSFNIQTPKGVTAEENEQIFKKIIGDLKTQVAQNMKHE